MSIQSSKSDLFDTADKNFHDKIEIFLEEFTPEQLIKLLEAIDSNYQIFQRGLAKYHNSKIKIVCDKILGADFDYSKYKNFRL